MKTFLLRTVLLTVVVACFSSSVWAKVWRVNRTPGVIADFAELSAVNNAAAVQNGDTVHVEGSSGGYNFFTLTKRLVLIGPGYYLAGAGANVGLQANTDAATVNVVLDTLSSGTKLIGLSGTVYLDAKVDNILILRSNLGVFGSGGAVANAAIAGLVIHQSVLQISLNNTHRLENFQITNCIVWNIASVQNSQNGLVRNNTFNNVGVTLSNSYISNNIFASSNLTAVNSTVRYNIATGNYLPAGNNNQNNVPAASLFASTGSYDGTYVLSATSPAKAAGEPINGITPDAGAFGTADPYRFSGIAPIPTVYQLSVPASVPSTAVAMTITVSTRSNN